MCKLTYTTTYFSCRCFSKLQQSYEPCEQYIQKGMTGACENKQTLFAHKTLDDKCPSCQRDPGSRSDRMRALVHLFHTGRFLH